MNPEITKQIRLAMARAGLDGARELQPILGQKLLNVQRKLKSSRPWTLADLEKIAKETNHRIELMPETTEDVASAEAFRRVLNLATRSITADERPIKADPPDGFVKVEVESGPQKESDQRDQQKPGVSSWP